MNDALPAPIPASILVVDDTPANLQLLAGMLKTHGYRVRPVNSGELALRAVQAEAPDLILLDITMPELDGYEVCRRLKANPAFAEIPVLFISALNGAEDKTLAFQVGGVDYVSKPFQFDEVAARVKTHLELRRQKRELETSLERLRHLESLRDSLTHMIVHDMRSPLAILQMNIEMMQMKAEEQDTTCNELVTNAHYSVDLLSDMVSQILDVSRMDAGKMQLQLEVSDLEAIGSRVLEAMKPLTGRKHLSLSCSKPFTVVCDPDVIRRVISNLVGNALKFTPPDGEVSVRIDRNAAFACVSVSDNGPGIEAALQDRIFEKFAQLDGPMRKAGAGLGLAFVKMAVEAHSGHITVDSQISKGSTFSFTLPLEQALS